MNRSTKRGTDVRVLTDEVSRWRVVADGEPGGEAGTLEAARTVDSGTTDLSGALPHDLSEVAKAVEVG